MVMHSTTFTAYHSALKIALVVFAFVLVFDSGLIVKSTTSMSDATQSHLANVVGVKVGVAPNEVNQLTARITELERDLDIKEREIAVNLNSGVGTGFDQSTFILSAILFILLVLIVFNYILDYLRERPYPIKNRSDLSVT
jgi:hypothetical protein